MSTLQNVRRVGNTHPAPVPASAPRGGQASGPGLFGLDGSRRPAVTTVRFTHVPAATRPSQVRGDDQPRRVAGLSYGARRAMIQARVAVGASNFFARAAAESARREEAEWRELADLAAQPEWDRAALYGAAGSVELQLAEGN